MKRSSLFFFAVASCGILSALVACGGISDPTKGTPTENVATVSGALTGTNVPSNAHVALVWRVGKTKTYAVGNDVAVVNGSFTMNLTPPPANYFAPAESSYSSLSGSGSGGSTPPSISEETPDPAPVPSGGSGTPGGGKLPAFAAPRIEPKDQVSGTITQPLTAALAGFIVYVDTNGNNQLDLVGEYADSPDQIIGGNKELMLAYLKDGGALDYEKLRDRSGILPSAGYNLAWEEGRWLPLNVVELKIKEKSKLPGAVCEHSDGDVVSPTTDYGGPSSPGKPNTSTPTDPAPSPPPNQYPPKGDPKLHCSADGYSWTYEGGWGECPPPPPQPVGLCAGDYSTLRVCAKMSGSSFDPVTNPTIPSNWPCDINPGPQVSTDAGVGPQPEDAGAGGDAGI